MQEFFDFLVKYWYLSGPFVLIFILLIIEEARSKGLMKQLAPQEAIHLINREKALIVDIREKNLFKQGHIINALNIVKAEIDKDINKLKSYKDKNLLIVCANGQYSGLLSSKLRKQGFEKVHVLKGGLSAWKGAGMPVVKNQNSKKS